MRFFPARETARQNDSSNAAKSGSVAAWGSNASVSSWMLCFSAAVAHDPRDSELLAEHALGRQRRSRRELSRQDGGRELLEDRVRGVTTLDHPERSLRHLHYLVTW